MKSARYKFLRFLALCTVSFAASAWFYGNTIAPLKTREQKFLQQRDELQQRITAGRLKLIAIKDGEQKLNSVRATMNNFVGDNSGDSALVTFPVDVTAHFAQLGFPNATVRLAAAEPARNLSGYQQIYWSIALPVPASDHSLKGLFVTIADLEELERLIKVTDFSVQPDVEDPEKRIANIGLVILARQ